MRLVDLPDSFRFFSETNIYKSTKENDAPHFCEAVTKAPVIAEITLFILKSKTCTL
jgi:hypothetical protein